MMTKFVGVRCSNVAYHGELEKKAAMEQKRVMTGENGEPVGDGEFQKFQNFVPFLESQVKANEVGGACSTHGRGEKCVQGFGGKARRKETTWKTKA
jgi:hypothetical protein